MIGGRALTVAELDQLRTGKIACRICGDPRPVDAWCPACDVDDQLDALRAGFEDRLDQVRDEVRRLDRRLDRAKHLAAGRWTPAGAGLEVRLS